MKFAFSRVRQKTDEHVQVIGIIRFSYLSVGGFQSVPSEPDEARAVLFDDARLERRFRLFEQVTIPTLAAQTDPDFTLIVLTAEDLPSHHLNRLHAAVERVPGGRVIQKPPMVQFRAVRSSIEEALRPNPRLTAQFRVDDDDGLALDFVARIREIAPEMFRMVETSGTETVCIDFTHGLRLVWNSEGVEVVARNRRLHTTQGMTLVTPKRAGKKLTGYAHHKIWHAMPMFCLNEPLMFLQCSHRDQDSGMIKRERLNPVEDRAEASHLLQERFGLDLDSLLASGV